MFIRVKAPFTALRASSVSCVVARVARRASLGTVHRHRLRHTAATETLNAGATLEEVAQLMRHEGIATTVVSMPRRSRPAGATGPPLAERRGRAMRAAAGRAMVVDYPRVRRSLGYKLEYTERLLIQFIDYLQPTAPAR